MTWLTWRQFRAQAITAVAALAAFAILLAVTESHMASLYAASGISGCHSGTCAGLASQFLQDLTSGHSFPLLPDGSDPYVIVYFLSVLAILTAPAIIGIFWGAPMIARELETGTCRLAWNQSVTRTRWLAVKLTLIGVAAMAVTETFSLLQAWWAAPIGKAVGLGGSASILTEGRFGPFVFSTHGITPLGYAAFGFALGVTAGLLIRRAIPAMAVTLAIFAVVQLVTPLWIRPHLLPSDRTIATIAAAGATAYPVGSTIAITAAAVPGQPGAWTISSAAVTTAGQPASLPAACESAIPRGQGGSPALDSCLASHGIRVAVSYQPVGRYWPLQSAETGLFLALALALAGFCFWRLGRRTS
ncbi:MAG TPA: ABC transporter permease [Streptosporangiaceae bacterium]|nr:ABC transporter permease [Streptosporangiaceae bacterium]